MFSLDASGKLKIESKKADVSADTSTEILLQFALQRRGLSMDQANLRVAAVVETPFEKRIVTLIYKRKFSKVPFEKADALLRKSFS